MPSILGLARPGSRAATRAAGATATFAHAGGNGDHVLDGAADLDADDVAAGEAAEVGPREELRDLLGKPLPPAHSHTIRVCVRMFVCACVWCS